MDRRGKLVDLNKKTFHVKSNTEGTNNISIVLLNFIKVCIELFKALQFS